MYNDIGHYITGPFKKKIALENQKRVCKIKVESQQALYYSSLRVQDPNFVRQSKKKIALHFNYTSPLGT